MRVFVFTLWYLRLVSASIGACSQQSPTFTLPDYSKHQDILEDVFQDIQRTIDSILVDSTFDTTAFSIEVTSSKQTVWSSFRTAREQNPSRPGVSRVDGNSVYRIASVTKVFTVHGILQKHAAGDIQLDDSIDRYLTEFQGPQSGTIKWNDITLRALGSQLSGLPFDWPKGGMSTKFPDPTRLGFPPQNNTQTFPRCSIFDEHNPCSEDDLLAAVKQLNPLFAPNFKSTYSNLAFELLGLALARASSVSYEEYVKKSILDPLGLSATTFIPPSEAVAVLPKDEAWYFPLNLGVQNPAGGLYSTSSDLSVYLRYILTHHNDMITGFNWLQPASYSTGASSYYGMPWEIYRPPRLPATTFYTKGGEMPGYVSNIALIPEYDLGITILVGGNPTLLPRLLEAVSGRLVAAAKEVIGRELRDRYIGTYSTVKLNSTLTLDYDTANGLYIKRWISNGTDFLAVLLENFLGASKAEARLVVVPTMLHKDDGTRTGERWRALPVQEHTEGTMAVWEDFCITHMYGVNYDGLPLNEIVFWDDEVELTALRVRLAKANALETEVHTKLIVQQP